MIKRCNFVFLVIEVISRIVVFSQIVTAIRDFRFQRLFCFHIINVLADFFFADVLVMDEDEDVRANRLRLLNRFVGVFTDVADFGKMAKGGK